jgi:hypothetical protein
MQRRWIAAGLMLLAAQGCYRPMYAPPYSSQGYPMGGYPGPIQTAPGQPYMPGTTYPSYPSTTTPPTGGGGVPTYNNAPNYNPAITNPSATRPVPTYGDAPSANSQFQQPETTGGNPLGYAPNADALMQTAGTAPATAPNPFGGGADAVPLNGQGGVPTTVTSDNFEGGNGAPSFN